MGPHAITLKDRMPGSYGVGEAIFTKMDIPARLDVARQLDELRERPLATAS
jgi:hypothetical protein